MNNEEYKIYREKVRSFFESEGIWNLSKVTPDDNPVGKCPTCGVEVDHFEYFSWSSCDCCNTREGGNRIHANGYNPKTREIQCYDICVDCEYYIEYGQLDDRTMMEIEEGEL